MYRFKGRITVIASALLIAMGGAWAQSSPSARLDLSQDALKILNITGTGVSVAAPGSLDETRTPRGGYASLALTTPVRPETWSGTAQGGLPTVVATQGGMTWSVAHDTLWAHGSDLKISNITIDGSRQRILADLDAFYSIGFKAQVPTWTFSSAEVTAPGVADGMLGQTVLKGLAMTEEARLLVVQGLDLALVPESDVARARIADWGTMTVGTAMAVVPEPSSVVLMALGCLGLMVAVRRQRARYDRVA